MDRSDEDDDEGPAFLSAVAAECIVDAMALLDGVEPDVSALLLAALTRLQEGSNRRATRPKDRGAIALSAATTDLLRYRR